MTLATTLPEQEPLGAWWLQMGSMLALQQRVSARGAAACTNRASVASYRGGLRLATRASGGGVNTCPAHSAFNSAFTSLNPCGPKAGFSPLARQLRTHLAAQVSKGLPLSVSVGALPSNN